MTTFALDTILEETLVEQSYIDSMREAIARFPEYRATLPLIPGGYTRTLLRRTPGFEVIAMQWAPGSVSGLHDHGDSRCWVVVMEGAIDVENYDRLDDASTQVARILRTSVNTIESGKLDYRLNWRELHQVRNRRSISAISLQLYAAPLQQYTVIDEKTGACRTASSGFDKTILL